LEAEESPLERRRPAAVGLAAIFSAAVARETLRRPSCVGVYAGLHHRRLGMAPEGDHFALRDDARVAVE
jgi:hypothetical protein